MRSCETIPYIWGFSPDGRFKYQSLTNDTLDGAFEVLRKSFFLYENVCKGVDLLSETGASEELERLCLDTAMDGVSMVALNVNTDQVVGVSFNKIQVLNDTAEKSYFASFKETCKCESSKALLDFMIDMDNEVDLFQHYKVNCILEIMFLATLPEFGQQRNAEFLVLSSLDLGRKMQEKNKSASFTSNSNENSVKDIIRIPQMASALMTSRYSQKIARKLDFEELAEISYDRFEFKGKKFSERIGKEHLTAILVAKRLV